MSRETPFSALIGKTLTAVIGGVGDDTLTFKCTDGSAFSLFHDQDCCGSVSVEDIAGDLSDIIGSPIVTAEESCGDQNPADYEPDEYVESFTWTFYKIDTAKGGVTMRWYGSSNGYYSENVSFCREAP